MKDCASYLLFKARAVGELVFKLNNAVFNQVVADMRPALVLRIFFVRSSRKLYRTARNFEFVRARALSNALDDVAITVARAKLHLRVSTRRVFAEDWINEANVLEEVAPVQG